ncbi:MAG: HlyD family secretion protein [Chitinophagaceae bacterium]|jgi:multidrug resistance efflux pump
MKREETPLPDWQASHLIFRANKPSRVRYWFWGLLAFLLLLLFLPWTQNIRSTGQVTTVRQEQRPQQLNTIIPGRVVKWYVKEGDQVKAGDTILQLAEIKDQYLDPRLIERTDNQLEAGRNEVAFYDNKVQAADQQLRALEEALTVKLDQLRIKLQQQNRQLQRDSALLQAANNDFEIAQKQWLRQRALYDSGLVSLTQLEQRNQTFQQTQARRTAAETAMQNTRQDLAATRLEIIGTERDYTEKIAKASADRFQSLSSIAGKQADIAKLENQLSNYRIRNGLYFITAPQTGQVSKARKAGIGEIVKEGELIAEIVPSDFQYAVEIFVRPMDLPLIHAGQKVRFQFDGFPAIIFSGWPQSSYGTFGGVVTAVENSVSVNGLFRVLVVEDPEDRPWPTELKMGTGAQSMALLKNVPIWYELWRNINGFPPDFYQPNETTKSSK